MEKTKKKGKDTSTSAKSGKKGKDAEKRPEKNCDECRKNFTHNTAQCWKLQKKNKANSDANGEKNQVKRTFSNKGFRKEVNLLAKTKGKSKREVLEMYAAMVKKEQNKLKPKKRKDESSDSEAEHSVDMVEPERTVKKKRLVSFDFTKESKQVEEKMPKEKAFLKRVMAQEALSEKDDNDLSDSNSEA